MPLTRTPQSGGFECDFAVLNTPFGDPRRLGAAPYKRARSGADESPQSGPASASAPPPAVHAAAAGYNPVPAAPFSPMPPLPAWLTMLLLNIGAAAGYWAVPGAGPQYPGLGFGGADPRAAAPISQANLGRAGAGPGQGQLPPSPGPAVQAVVDAFMRCALLGLTVISTA